MEIIGGILCLGGLVATVISQIYIINIAFKFSSSAGLYCLLITPIYAFTSDLRKETKVRNALRVWVASFLIFILGMFVLTAI
jgi:uncharacterized membrane protein